MNFNQSPGNRQRWFTVLFKKNKIKTQNLFLKQILFNFLLFFYSISNKNISNIKEAFS